MHQEPGHVAAEKECPCHVFENVKCCIVRRRLVIKHMMCRSSSSYLRGKWQTVSADCGLFLDKKEMPIASPTETFTMLFPLINFLINLHDMGFRSQLQHGVFGHHSPCSYISYSYLGRCPHLDHFLSAVQNARPVCGFHLHQLKGCWVSRPLQMLVNTSCALEGLAVNLCR